MAKKSKDEPIDSWTWNREPNNTFGWTQMQLPEGLVPEDLPKGQRFSVFVGRFKSSSPDCELIIHDPLKSLIDAGVIKPGRWRVTTHVLNHERTLSKWHLFVTATVSPGAVGLSLYKVAPPRDAK